MTDRDDCQRAREDRNRRSVPSQPWKRYLLRRLPCAVELGRWPPLWDRQPAPWVGTRRDSRHARGAPAHACRYAKEGLASLHVHSAVPVWITRPTSITDATNLALRAFALSRPSPHRISTEKSSHSVHFTNVGKSEPGTKSFILPASFRVLSSAYQKPVYILSLAFRRRIDSGGEKLHVPLSLKRHHASAYISIEAAVNGVIWHTSAFGPRSGRRDDVF